MLRVGTFILVFDLILQSSSFLPLKLVARTPARPSNCSRRLFCASPEEDSFHGKDDETIFAIKKSEVDHVSKDNHHHRITKATRREIIQNTALLSLLQISLDSASASAKDISIRRDQVNGGKNNDAYNNSNSRYGTLYDIHDPNTYSALVYKPDPKLSERQQPENNTENNNGYPVIILLHGAGNNDINDVWNLANPNGEHAGLIPSLLYNSNIELNYSGNGEGSNSSSAASNSNKQQNTTNIKYGTPPVDLLENFVVIAPYSYGKQSFYEEPRSKILSFIKWACKYVEGGDGDDHGSKIHIDTTRLFLFGFSDGATLGVELMTTRSFAGGIFAAYGFTGKLPSLALERLKGQPMWIFHSADDVIFPVACSDKLVDELRSVNKKEGGRQMIRYTRYDKDQEGFTGSVKGHSTGITASKDQEVYKWLLSL